VNRRKQLRLLVAWVGNSDRGDDGVGPAVARRLCGRVPSAVSVLQLSGDPLALIEDWKGFSAVIVIDAGAPITRPGLIHRFDLANSRLPITIAPGSTHAFGLAETIELARSLGRLPSLLVAYLIEGEQFEPGAPLSPAVAQAAEAAAAEILVEVSTMLGTPQTEGGTRRA
jgi:hydrogenase maturation protease